MIFLSKTSASVSYSLTIFPIGHCSALIVYTSVIHPESPERNDVALGELDVVFHYICVRDVFNLLLPFPEGRGSLVRYFC